MSCYTLNGKPVDFDEFLRTHGIGYGPAGSADPVYRALLELNPGENYTRGFGTIYMLPYDGNLKTDLRRQVELAHIDHLSNDEIAELRVLTPKIHAYLYGDDD